MNILKVAVFAVFAAGGATAIWSQLPGPAAARETFAKACEETLRGRLDAPATYKRVSVIEAPPRASTLEEFMGNYTPEQVQAAKELAAKNEGAAKVADNLKIIFEAQEHLLYEIVIEYDAANHFGTPIRGLATCVDVAPKGTPPGGSALGPAVNGLTKLGWHAARMIELQ